MAAVFGRRRYRRLIARRRNAVRRSEHRAESRLNRWSRSDVDPNAGEAVRQADSREQAW
jgi:hypothetical protein